MAKFVFLLSSFLLVLNFQLAKCQLHTNSPEKKNNFLSFTNISEETGIKNDSLSFGGHAAIFSDVDSDGLPDLYFTMLLDGPIPDLFFYNLGNNIFVEDAITAFLQAAEGVGKMNMIYNLVGPKKVTMNELVRLVLNTIKNLGLNIPEPAIEYVPYEQAPERFEICKDMIDVMRCDIIENGEETAALLHYTLSPLNMAIEAAVKDILVHNNKKSGKKAIILLSGGIDSATALYWAVKNDFKVIILTINYKWRPKKEILATKTLSELLSIPLVEVSAPYIQDAVDLRMDGYPVPSATHAPQGYIPLRNLVFYSIAAYYAAIYGCQFVIGGHLKDDIEKFNDTRTLFFEGLEKLIDISKHSKDKSKIEFLFPFSTKSKAEVIKIAQDLEVPIDQTWSCYGDYEIPCGRCVPCMNRKKALENQK